MSIQITFLCSWDGSVLCSGVFLIGFFYFWKYLSSSAGIIYNFHDRTGNCKEKHPGPPWYFKPGSPTYKMFIHIMLGLEYVRWQYCWSSTGACPCLGSVLRVVLLVGCSHPHCHYLDVAGDSQLDSATGIFSNRHRIFQRIKDRSEVLLFLSSRWHL